MSLAKGTVVISAAGRDKGRLMAVLWSDNVYASLADGKLRKIETPKRKKLIHVSKTNTVLDPEEMRTDKQLRKALATRFSQNAKFN